MFELVDYKTKKTVTTDSLVYTGRDGPWEVSMDRPQIKDRIYLQGYRSSPPCLFKYLPFMPVEKKDSIVSLKEGETPLLPSKVIGKKLGINLFFKLEGKNPTGSFKDRGSVIDVTVAKLKGARGLVLASTGNMAASCSCYAAAARIPCYIIVPEGVPASKLAQVISFGGRVIQVKGTYDDAARLAEKIAYQYHFYLAGDYAFRVEGQKTAFFEIIDQFNYQAPDVIVLPMGCGTNMAAYYKGICDYQFLNLLDKTPKLWGVQAEGASPIVQAIVQKSTLVAQANINTIASAIAVGAPLDGLKALDAINHTAGRAVSVTDQEMRETQYLLATEEGLFVESSSAATVAGVLKAARSGLNADKNIVCVLTGDGLKDTSVMLDAALAPPTINPQLADFDDIYNQGIGHEKTVVFVEKKRQIFDVLPDFTKLNTVISDIFGIKLRDQQLKEAHDLVSKFLNLGKKITIADLQDIIQSTRQMINKASNFFSVDDFLVSTRKNGNPHAQVTVLINGEKHSASASGTGPVDAVISALKLACHHSIQFSLVDYKVKIRDEGTNALVQTTISLRFNHKISQGHATSTDIIQASISAFENAYAGLVSASKDRSEKSAA